MQPVRKLLFGLMLVALLLAAGLSAKSSEQAQRPADQSRPLVFAVDVDFPPFVTDKLPEGGLAVELVKAVYDLEGQRIELVTVPWNRAFRMVQDGDVDGSFLWGMTDKRAKLVNFSDVVFGSKPKVFSSKTVGTRDIAAAMKGQTFCNPASWMLTDAFKETLTMYGVFQIYPQSYKNCIMRLARGTVSLLRQPPIVIGFAYARYPTVEWQEDLPALTLFPMAHVDHLTVNEGTQHVIFQKSPSGQAQAAAFNKAFRSYVQSGQYQALVDRHLRHYPPEFAVPVQQDLRDLGLYQVPDSAPPP